MHGIAYAQGFPGLLTADIPRVQLHFAYDTTCSCLPLQMHHSFKERL